MGIFDRKPKTSGDAGAELASEVLKKERKGVSERCPEKDRPCDPGKLPEGPDGGFVYHDE